MPFTTTLSKACSASTVYVNGVIVDFVTTNEHTEDVTFYFDDDKHPVLVMKDQSIVVDDRGKATGKVVDGACLLKFQITRPLSERDLPKE